ncbi:MAG: hypothetical protein HZB30_12315 [Nitrospirae bacterium]|nr:hypothetical protein [Nitrospirota bacterium]
MNIEKNSAPEDPVSEVNVSALLPSKVLRAFWNIERSSGTAESYPLLLFDNPVYHIIDLFSYNN